MNALKSMLRSEVFRGIISIIAAIVMYYTPDQIDLIIQTLLSFYGITVLIIKEKDSK
jgi:hypothetical protein